MNIYTFVCMCTMVKTAHNTNNTRKDDDSKNDSKHIVIEVKITVPKRKKHNVHKI